MRKILKNKIGLLVSVALITLPLLASAATDVSQVSVTSKIHPKATFALNFDAFNFDATAGSGTNAASYSKLGGNVPTPNYMVTSKKNFTLLISGTDLISTTSTLTVGRIGIVVGGSGPLKPLTTAPTSIDSSTAPVNAVVKSVAFNLNLTDTGTTYPDNDKVSKLLDETDFTSTVTFSFTGL